MTKSNILADNARNNLLKREVVKYPWGQCGKDLRDQNNLEIPA